MDAKLKGDLAESIVKYMFRASGIKGVFSIETDSGRESLFKYLPFCKNLHVDIEQLKKDLVKRNNVAIPDLALVTYQRGLELIEVKYREFNGNWAKSIGTFDQEVGKLLEVWSPGIWNFSVMLVSKVCFLETRHFTVFQKESFGISFGDISRWKIKRRVLERCEQMIGKIYGQDETS